MNNPFNFTLFSEKKNFFIAVLLQLIIIVLIVLMKFIFLGSGNHIILEINSIEYKTTAEKEYVSIQYDVSKINSYYGNTFRKGDTVYVTLREYNKMWSGSFHSIEKNKPVGSSFIKGKIIAIENSESHSWNSYNNYTISYNIENFSVPMHRPELNSKRGHAIISLDKEGNAELKNIYIDGKKWP